MAFIPADKTAQVVAQFTWDNQPCENVYWFLGTAEWTSTLLQSLANAVAGWITADALNSMATNVSAVRVLATDWSTQSGPQVESTTGLPSSGVNAGLALPNNSTIAIKHVTGLRGRSFRGRTFWIGLNDTMRSDNAITVGARTALIASLVHLNALASAVNGAQMSVVSFRHNNAPRGSAVVTPIISFTIEQTLDSMRRRLPGHNRHR